MEPLCPVGEAGAAFVSLYLNYCSLLTTASAHPCVTASARAVLIRCFIFARHSSARRGIVGRLPSYILISFSCKKKNPAKFGPRGIFPSFSWLGSPSSCLPPWDALPAAPPKLGGCSVGGSRGQGRGVLGCRGGKWGCRGARRPHRR